MRPGKTLRVARWEVSRSAGTLDRRTLVAAVCVLALLAALAPFVAAGGAPDEGVYRIAISDDSPYAEAVSADRSLRAVPPSPDAVRQGRADVLVGDGAVEVADSHKGRAALGAFRDAVRTHNDRLMRAEADRAAAFPVEVTLVYAARGASADGAGSTSGAGTGGGNGGGLSGRDTGTDPGSGESGDGTRNTGDGFGGTAGLGDVVRSAGGAFLGGSQSGSPADIRPPFPLRSLVLAFAFVVPLNVVIQAYGSSVMSERLKRRGELLLASPVSRTDIVAGKTLPYLAGSVLVTAGIAAVIGGGPVTVVAVAPIVLLFLASTFVGAMFARSFKELTFVTVTVSVLGTSYAFVPAIFTEVHPVAAISPLTMVVRDLTGTPVQPATFAFATLPMTLVATALFALGTGVYREEDMFTQLSIPSKVLDALAAHLTVRRVAVWSVLSIPFVFATELFAVSVLFVLPATLSVPLLFTVVAVVEEVAKSLHVYAGFERNRFDRSLRTAALVGGLSGLGFALGEKLSLVAQVVGLPELELGRAAFAPAAASEPATLAALFALPFALHVGTATLSSLGARRSAGWYVAALGLAVLVHLAYNLVVVSSLV